MQVLHVTKRRKNLVAYTIAAGFAALVLTNSDPVIAQGTAKPECKPIEVPKAQAESGRVYYVVQTGKPQMTFDMRAEYLQFEGTSRKIDGYMVVPKNDELPAATALAGQFCLPVASIVTGNLSRDVYLETDFWLDSDHYPEITFKLTKVRPANRIRGVPGSELYGAALDGEITIAGQTRPLAVATRIRMMTEGPATRSIAPGDLMTIHAVFGIDLRDFGIEGQKEFLTTGRMVMKLKVTVELTLSTVRPDPHQKRVEPPPPKKKKKKKKAPK